MKRLNQFLALSAIASVVGFGAFVIPSIAATSTHNSAVSSKSHSVAAAPSPSTTTATEKPCDVKKLPKDTKQQADYAKKNKCTLPTNASATKK